MNNVSESVARDVRYACRQLLRAPLAALTIVVTVGLGLGLVAAVYTILNAMVFRVDEVRNPHELFSVERQPSAIAQAELFDYEQYEALLRDTNVFTDAFASTADVSVWIEGVRREGRVVTGNFFGVLGVGAELGRALTASDDEPGRPPVLVLSHRAWVQHYDSDPAVVGSSYRVNGTLFQVVGVMPDGFRGLEIVAAPDFWAPYSLADQLRERAGRRVRRSHDRRAARAGGVARAGARRSSSRGTRSGRLNAAAPATSAQRRASCSRRSSARCRGRPKPCSCSCRCSSRSG